MRKGAAFLLAAALASLAGAQQIAVETGVINIEVPVRVFRAGAFVDDLKIGDFEILENGRPIPLDAVYLVRKRTVERSDEVRRFTPRTNRSFYLFFEISEFTPRMGSALEYFIQDVIVPGDSLTVVTPLKTYRLKAKAFEVRSRPEIVQQITGLLRHDALLGSSAYRSVMADLEDLAKTIGSALSQNLDPVANSLSTSAAAGSSSSTGSLRDYAVEDLLTRYETTLGLLENQRAIDVQKLLQFPRTLKTDPDQKFVYMFYQREYIPKIEPRILYQYMDQFQDRPTVNQTITGIFDFYRRDVPFELDAVKKAYADASVAIHFLLVAEPAPQSPGVVFREQSEDIFGAFREMAAASGGFTESSANPLALMKDAVESSENYYLLYYIPRPYVKDGKFKSITVRVKRPDVRVVHRMGYFAD
jgi:hypothetical protein